MKMFLSNVLRFSIVIGLLAGLSVVKSEVSALKTSSLAKSRIQKRVENWVPIPMENSEIKRVYFFNITNLDDYLDNEDVKIKVEELEPIVFQSTYSVPRFLHLSSNENTITFQIAYSHTLDSEAEKFFDRNDKITRITSDSVFYLESPQNLLNIIKNPLNNTSKQRTKNAFESVSISELKNQENAQPHFRSSIYDLYTGKDYESLEGKIENKVGHDESICFSSNSPCSRTYKTATDVHLQFLKKSVASPEDEFELKVLFFDRPMTFIRNNIYPFKGVNLTRFVLDESEMSMQNEDNSCLCEDKSKEIEAVALCDMSGILDAKVCALEPKVYSNPHFLDASDVLKSHIKGLTPDQLKHKSYVDVDPVTGVILNYRLSTQLNTFLKISRLGFKKEDILVPNLWIEYVSEKSESFMELYNLKRLELF